MSNTPPNPTLPAFSISEWRSFPVNKHMLRNNRVPYASDTHTNFRAAWEAHEAQQSVGEVEAFIHDYLCVPRLGPDEKDLQPELPAFYVGTRTQLLKRLRTEYIGVSPVQWQRGLGQFIALGWVRPIRVGKGIDAYVAHGARVYPARKSLPAGALERWGVDAMSTVSLQEGIVLRPLVR